MAGTNAPVTDVYNQMSDEIVSTPAYVANNPQAATLNSNPNAGLGIFDNPVPGFTDTGVSHTGDMGKLSS